MNSPSERFLVALATPSDGPELAALYAADDGFPGDVRVLFTRGTDAYVSLLSEGDAVVVPIVRERASGRIVGMGACVIRDAWVNGTPHRVGYLTGLKGLPEFRGRVPLIPADVRVPARPDLRGRASTTRRSWPTTCSPGGCWSGGVRACPSTAGSTIHHPLLSGRSPPGRRRPG